MRIILKFLALVFLVIPILFPCFTDDSIISFDASITAKKKMPGLMHEISVPFEKITLGMGCFWAGESLYGAEKGVLRTRVGYSDGTGGTPTYRSIGDYTEVIEVDFNPKEVSLEKLLNLFWENHEYGLTKKQKKQYCSLILYHNMEQKTIAEKSLEEQRPKQSEAVITLIKPAGTFYPAEDYHQKYRLQEHTFLINQMCLTREQLQTSHVAAKLNGYVSGVGSIELFNSEAEKLGLNEEMIEYVRKVIKKNEGGLRC